ncbi:MAG: cytochrome c [Gammaproteobacteria bacterium]|nr:cytochrome c [Gammaproteobacteria bacterium]
MKRWQLTLLLVIVSGVPGLSIAFPWDKDMVDQPSEKPQESEAPPDPGSVPVSGGESLPLPLNDEQSFARKDASADLVNPVAASADSIRRGQEFYDVNCLVCHGAGGKGDGPVGLKFVEKAPVDLNDAYTQDQTDGELFFTLTRGRVKMPFYRDALSPSERWDVINYLRSEFGSK